uniref:PPIase cyclophilin-type domain-containing protein n=1 Tax=Parascaris univalens TaxID=6257 RepID=A0A915BTC3_PARUN
MNHINSVLAEDCRSTEPKFAVLMKKVTKGSEEKKMKIIDEEPIIGLQHVIDEVEVTVDGHVERDEEKLERIGVNKGNEVVFVELEYVTIRFDGEMASVKMSPFFKNGQCDICGHYDGEGEDELRKADDELIDDLEKYHRSYFADDSECKIEEELVGNKTNYRIRFDGHQDLFEESQELRKPIMRTDVIEYSHELCFSKKPVF